MRDYHIPRLAVLGACAALGAVPFRTAAAQDRLVNARTASAGIVIETVSFGSGLEQATAGNTRSTIKSATQWIVPLSVMVPVSDVWSVDAAAALGSGQVTFVTPPTGQGSTAKLGGLSDVRLRVNGRVRENVLLTLGVNAPTGVTGLTAEQTAALGVLAAPALGVYLPGVSLGPSGTAGLVFSRAVGDWGVAAGASYEVRGSFSPVAALSAGVATPEFNPGNAMHFSLGTNGIIGSGALTLSLTADLYRSDRFASTGSASSAATTKGGIRLGPTFGADLQYKMGFQSFRDVTLYISERRRSSFTRDDVSVAGSDANYLSAGLQTIRPISPVLEIMFNLDAWSHSGLEVDKSLITAATTAGAATLGFTYRMGRLGITPFVRARGGSLDTGLGSGSFTGGSGGLTVSTRF